MYAYLIARCLQLSKGALLEALRTRLKDHDNDDIEKMAEENLRLLKKVGG